LTNICKTVALMALGISATTANAQMYRCINGSTSFYSDRPCATQSPKVDKLVSVGPLQSPQRTPSEYRSSNYYPSMEGAPKHQKYLSGACASMADAIRTAPTRGVNYSVIRDLNREYDEKCREEDRLARSQSYDDEQQARQARQASLDGAKIARQENVRTQEQCNAMREVISTKRQTLSSMTPGEKSNFQTLEASFNERCVKPRTGH